MILKTNLRGGEMKNVIISADGDRMVYSVPNIVADNLTEYCIEFCDKWLRTSSHAKKIGLTVAYVTMSGISLSISTDSYFPKSNRCLLKILVQ